MQLMVIRFNLKLVCHSGTLVPSTVVWCATVARLVQAARDLGAMT